MKFTENIKHLIKGDSKQIKLSSFTYNLILTKLETLLNKKRDELSLQINRPTWLEIEIKELEKAIIEFKGLEHDKQNLNAGL